MRFVNGAPLGMKADAYLRKRDSELQAVLNAQANVEAGG
jgi:hypothetical protein